MNKLKSKQSVKGYTPIVFAEQHCITTREELDPFDEYVEQHPDSLISSISPDTKKNHSQHRTLKIASLPMTRFPSILKQTKKDMRKFREYEKSLLDDGTEAPKLHSQEKVLAEQESLIVEFAGKKNKRFTSLPTMKPILTDLTTLHLSAQQSMISSQAKFQQLSYSPNLQWTNNNQVTRINKAYEIQKEMNHLQRFKTVWKSDTIQQYLQQKIIQGGLNVKRGLRQVYLLIYLPHQSIVLRSSQTEVKSMYLYIITRPTEIELNSFLYFIPTYESAGNQPELLSDFKEWFSYFLDLLHMKNRSMIRCFLLDGRQIKTLNQIPQYEKFLYVSLSGECDFWDKLKDIHNLHGNFMRNKYAKVATRLFDIKTKEDVDKFFSKREHFLQFYGKEASKKGTQLSLASAKCIEVQDDKVPPTTEMFDKSIVLMTKKESDSYLQVVQAYINQSKQKYDNPLKNMQEKLQNRLSNIKEERRKSIEGKYKSKAFLKFEEGEHIERKLLHEDVMSVEEIQDDAMDHVDNVQQVNYRKQLKLLSVDDPFQSFQHKDNGRFQDIAKLINIEKIVLEKKITRADVLHYLSIFKALMDSDEIPRIKDVVYPTLFISLGQLKRGLPYIALHRNKVNTKKLTEVNSRAYNYVDFMEFLDIFTTDFTVTDQELLEQ